jgi:hypothetical protein
LAFSVKSSNFFVWQNRRLQCQLPVQIWYQGSEAEDVEEVMPLFQASELRGLSG